MQFETLIPIAEVYTQPSFEDQEVLKHLKMGTQKN